MANEGATTSADPALRAVIEQMRAADVLGLPTVEAMREAIEAVGRTHPVDPDIDCRAIRAGGVPAEWITAPGACEDDVLLYLHGGGYVIGSVATHRALAGRLSRASRMRALLLDYRLAPEHPFPAAIDDAVAAYRWLVSTGIDAGRIAITGDSAGGGLAIATLVALRDAAIALPAAAVCISPWTDLEVSGESMTTRATIDPMYHQQGIVRLAKTYLAGQDARSPLASPLHASLRGLPPRLVHVGEAGRSMMIRRASSPARGKRKSTSRSRSGKR